MSDIAVKVENLGKLYHIGARQEQYPTLRSALVSGIKRLTTRRSAQKTEENTLWALKDISFEIKQGEVVGIIGRNGAGKSTLLKVLAHITEPTKGRVSLYGRVGSLLEVGTGFHPELTGRDNIYLNGAILGMKRVEIQRKFDEIVAFSEIEKFLDTPVKRYSSGMYVRLAFAVAAHLEPEILVVDEVLAVGDVGFQKKCLGKMEDIAQGGRTVLFVSHNLGAVSKLCKNAFLLNQGVIVDEGEVQTVINSYLQKTSMVENQIDEFQHNKDVFLSIKSVDANGVPTARFLYDQEIYIQFVYKLVHDIKGLYITFSIYTANGYRLMFADIKESKTYVDLPNRIGVHTVTARIPARTLSQGVFFLSAGLSVTYGGIIDLKDHHMGFEIIKLDSFRDESNRPPLCVEIDWSVSLEKA